jgi:hypothetical protein
LICVKSLPERGSPCWRRVWTRVERKRNEAEDEVQLTRVYRMTALLLLAALVALPGLLRAQEAKPPLKPEEIEALVAPIALYPDSLLSQVLMASTYPLEVVQAARWVQANPKVTGDAAVKAVEKQAWDVSVKSLVAFPQVLTPMNEKLDWTQKLGDAFLSQKTHVMEAVQRLRQQAHKAGNLKSTEQQKVIVEQAPSTQQTVIKVEPADPQVVYVPAYNPTVVYGTWAYPAYPPYYWPPPPVYYPGGYLAAGFAFGLGVVTVGAIFGDCNWGNNDIDIDIDKAVNIDRNFDSTRVKAEGGKANWQHDPSHRKGVTYRDQASRDKYAASVPGADGRRDYRGHEGGAGQAQRGDGVPGGDRRAGTSTQPAGPGGDRPDFAGADGDGAFAGVDRGAQTKQAADRGRVSTGSMAANRPSPAARPSGGGAPRPASRPSGGGGRRR